MAINYRGPGIQPWEAVDFYNFQGEFLGVPETPKIFVCL